MSGEGLRERKKRKLRRQIRDVTVRLIDEQGFAGTTVEQIADACDIAPSTFFRHYRNKEEAATADFLDVNTYEVLSAAPPDLPLLELLAQALDAMFTGMSDDEWRTEALRMKVLQQVPELRDKMMAEFTRPIALARELLVSRGYSPQLAATIAGAVIGALSTVSFAEGVERVTMPATKEEAAASFRRAVAAVGQVVVIPPPDAREGDAR